MISDNSSCRSLAIRAVGRLIGFSLGLGLGLLTASSGQAQSTDSPTRGIAWERSDGGAATERPRLGPPPEPWENAIVQPRRPVQPNSGQFSAARGQVRTALDGYSPVSLHRHGKWVAGQREYASMYRGLRYRFVDLEELLAFVRQPEAYAPWLDGDCPVHWVRHDQRVPGQVGHALRVGQHIVLFSSAEARQAFIDNPDPYCGSR